MPTDDPDELPRLLEEATAAALQLTRLLDRMRLIVQRKAGASSPRRRRRHPKAETE